jgi:CubicO group peptidase (beta-lactamase class C family)
MHHVPIGPETPVYSLFPNVSPDLQSDSRRQQITLASLMTHSSGLACDDNDNASPGREDEMQNHRELDWYKYVLDLPIVHPVGQKWAYCSGGINLVAGAVRQATHTWLPEYFDRYIARPLQFGHYYTQLMPDGEAYMGGGMYFRPRDFLKIGQVYLDGGAWHGLRIVDRAWVEASIVPRIKGYDDDGEGYAWHIYSITSGGHKYREIEANGTGGQIIMIMPELDLTVFFTAGNFNSYSVSRKSREELVAQILIPGITGK